MNESTPSISYVIGSHRKKNQVISSPSISKFYESISSHLFSVESESINSADDDVFCTFALRRTTIRKLQNNHCDYFTPKTKHEPCFQVDRSSKFVKTPSSESVDRFNDTVLSTTSYDSPVKRTKKTKAMIVHDELDDITVDFADRFSLQSPKSVIMDEIFSHSINLDDENIENLIFGTNHSIDDEPSVHKYENFNDDSEFLTHDTVEYEYEDDSENEGLVWQRILKDLKCVRNCHSKGATSRANKDVDSKKMEDLGADTSLLLLSSSSKDDTAYSEAIKNLDEQSQCFNGGLSQEPKNRRRFTERHQSNTTSTRSNLSNDALTLSTYTGSSLCSIASNGESNSEDIEQHDITVVDTRPFCCTIVRRLSIFLIQNEKRWTIDKEIASLFPNYLTCAATTDENGLIPSRNISPLGTVIRRQSQNQNEIRNKYTMNQNFYWRFWLRYRNAKQRLQTMV